ncbi:hypothetical protein DPMN_183048 [Dreissena polymorpha]|uniref:Uncharacterized protein n=1 Tax=Dreissena polymorpha TaxID=45954 RepID=A0A9D4I6Q8_DREPO|nr:hypothetical protein DPMN_183048 [Dreissena polymorpha]
MLNKVFNKRNTISVLAGQKSSELYALQKLTGTQAKNIVRIASHNWVQFRQLG